MDKCEFICPDSAYVSLSLSFSTMLNVYLIKIEDDTKSRTIQEILLNVNNKSTICLRRSGSPGYIYINISGLCSDVMETCIIRDQGHVDMWTS